MFFEGSLQGLAGTDTKTVNGVIAQLVGDTYVPAAGLISDPPGWMTSKGGNWKMLLNGVYIGTLKQGGKNGRFVADGAPIIWPTVEKAAPAISAPSPPKLIVDIAPQAQKSPDVQSAPPPIISPRSESIPVIQSGSTSYIPPSGGGTSLVELPGSASTVPPTNEGPADTAEAAAQGTIQEAGMGWLGWLLIAGAGYGLIKGKKNGKRRRR